MGIAVITIAAVLYIHMPQLKALSEAVLLFTPAHIIIVGLVMISAYLLIPQKLIYLLFGRKKLQKMEGKYYFGWSFGWMNLYYHF